MLGTPHTATDPYTNTNTEIREIDRASYLSTTTTTTTQSTITHHLKSALRSPPLLRSPRERRGHTDDGRVTCWVFESSPKLVVELIEFNYGKLAAAVCDRVVLQRKELALEIYPRRVVSSSR